VKPAGVKIQAMTIAWSSQMSGLKTRTVMLAAVLLPIAAHAACTAEGPRAGFAERAAGPHLYAATGEHTRLAAALTPWSRKWHKRWPGIGRDGGVPPPVAII
jgi:hypothetical protein